jgi:peptidyl-prolyl cis-trans isomerase B (cyclophilin B)
VLSKFIQVTILAIIVHSTGFISPISANTKPIVKMDIEILLDEEHATTGNIIFELYQKKAPITVNNFLRYVKEGFYENTIFHRVIDDFMIQGGGFNRGLKRKKTHTPIINEATNGLNNNKYTVAMARTNEINSATSQFFINLTHNLYLDHKNKSPNGFGYAVFGKVIDGFETIDKIRALKTTTIGYYSDVPVSDVVIKKIEILREPKKKVSEKKKPKVNTIQIPKAPAR